MEEREVRELAEAVRSALDELIADDSERAAVEARLVEALARPSGTARDALRAALRSHAATRGWVRTHTSVAVDDERAMPLGGFPAGPLGVYFICPNCDFDFNRDTVADVVPPCPNDGTTLVRGE